MDTLNYLINWFKDEPLAVIITLLIFAFACYSSLYSRSSIRSKRDALIDKKHRDTFK
ncbi:hypothetical protein HMPREF9318_01250 [Streptococcus urinalis FB127-CNA-2]|uniref:Uncharacterized protein n=1 Tax=Streptococcus urinalis 2285-97 TaxID=764291 RepID=G5KC98_9STRE|nr:hypothetical protein [Streptococcus urinalis]EHJ57026.1 hypothetical protein STRUR_0412 [Streptococcus urinalis 2285-97]EKS19728.1 hypothetical protein HMPREF9318_01250 [Streptococcus urinalis FB127-CNA-2]VEF31305.1 Uncharacterised protein [Streptococcus urinalis]